MSTYNIHFFFFSEIRKIPTFQLISGERIAQLLVNSLVLRTKLAQEKVWLGTNRA